MTIVIIVSGERYDRHNVVQDSVSVEYYQRLSAEARAAMLLRTVDALVKKMETPVGNPAQPE